MKNLIKGVFLTLLCGISFSAFSQNVGINTTGKTPSTNAILDLNTGNAKNLGIIIPRVVLGASLTTFSPPMANTATGLDSGMVIYNWQATNQPVGYYFWNGSTWTGIAAGTTWQLTGNTGTTAGTNFLGTSDDNALEFRVNGQKSGWLDYASPNNTTFGYESGNSLNNTGTNNLAAGYQALFSNIAGDSNTASGYQSLYNTMGGGNTGIGNQALYSNAYGGDNVAIGNMAIYNGQNAHDDVATGYQALYNNSSATYDVASGFQALYGVQSGNNDIGIGSMTQYSNSSGSNIIAIGNQAVYSLSSGSNTIGIGFQAVYNSLASDNIGIGYQALYGTGQYSADNIAIGYQALASLTYGTPNIAIGYQSLTNSAGGEFNTAMGYKTLTNSVTGEYCTAIGYQALLNDVSTYTNANNTAIGAAALQSNTTGYYNTALGYNAGYYNTSGQENTFLGYQAGYNSSLTTYTNVTCVGYNSGSGATLNSNSVYLGNSSTAHIYGQITSITAYSDRRVKDNIKENVPGLAFITKLHPVTYNLNIHKENQILGVKNDADYPGKYDIEKILQSGFIAQQVDSAAQACGYDFNGLDKPKTPNGLYALSYTTFVVPLVQAVQEQQKMIEEQKKTIVQQQTSIDEMKQELDILKQKMDALTNNSKQPANQK